MKKFFGLKIRRYHFLVLAFVIAIAVTGCVYIDSFSVTQVIDGKEVNYAYANTEATFTLKGHIEAHEDHSDVNFVVGFLVPKSWKVAENGKVTYKCDLAEDHDQIMTMSVMPSSQLPKNGNGRTWVECLTQEYGVGTNVLDDMEWVVFQTDDKYTIINNQFPTYTIWLKTNVGEKNLKCHIGVFVNHTDDGFSNGSDHKKVQFSSECFEVVGGKGATLDFCSNHYNKVSPMTSLQNDLITFTFNGSVNANKLAGADAVYFNGTAYTTDGKKYELTERSAKTQMTRENAYSDNYSITVWPVGLFGIPVTETIERITYYFTSKDGVLTYQNGEEGTITLSDDDYMAEGTAIPSVKEPFNFTFECE